MGKSSEKFFQRGGFGKILSKAFGCVQGKRDDFCLVSAFNSDFGAVDRLGAGRSRANVVSIADFCNDLHGCFSRCAGYFDCLSNRLWHSGCLPRPWNSPYIWGSVALVLTYSAYVAEIFRSGIDSVHYSQRSAALSLGLSEGQAMRDVILPQAVRNVVPSQMNMLIALQKDVSLLSFIGPVEIFRQAGVFKSLLANFTPYVGAAIIFLAVTIPATRYADYLMAKQTRERR